MTPSEATARSCVQLSLDKKAQDIIMLDLRRVGAWVDFFILATAMTGRQLEAVCDHIQTSLKQQKVRPLRREGDPDSGWMIVDYGDVMVHLFLSHTREFYALDRLWADAPREKFDGMR